IGGHKHGGRRARGHRSVGQNRLRASIRRPTLIQDWALCSMFDVGLDRVKISPPHPPTPSLCRRRHHHHHNQSRRVQSATTPPSPPPPPPVLVLPHPAPPHSPFL